MAEPRGRRSLHEHPWLVILAALGSAATIASFLGNILGDVPLWVVLAVAGAAVVVALAVLTVRAILRLRGALWDLRARYDSFLREQDTLQHRLTRHELADVIAEARRKGWTVTRLGTRIQFESPDNDKWGVPTDIPIPPQDVAKQLSDLSPQHFDADWQTPTKLDERVKALEDRSQAPRALQWARAVSVLESEGWTVEDTGDQFVVHRGERKTTVHKPVVNPKAVLDQLLGYDRGDRRGA